MSAVGTHLPVEVQEGRSVVPVVHPQGAPYSNSCDKCVFAGASEDTGCEDILCTGSEREDEQHVYFVQAPPVIAAITPLREADPSGKDPHTAGAKLDAGKIDPSLILEGMPRALMEVAKVGTYGAVKYSRHGWLAVPMGITRYTAALDRHRLKEKIEGKFDLDAKRDDGVAVRHAAQLAWNALARLELMLIEEEQLLVVKVA